MRKIVLFVLTMTMVVSVVAEATVIDGSVWTEFYAYKERLQVDQSHLRSLQGLKIGARDAFLPGLSFFIKGRVASDLSHKFSTDPDFRVYGAYAEYAQKWLTLRAGRQFMYAGLGGFTMDGGRIDLKFRNSIMLTGYGGTTPGPSFFDFDKIDSWKKSSAFGGRAKFTALEDWILGASFLEQQFKPDRGLNSTLVPKKRTDTRLGSLDLTYSKKIYSVLTRGDYDFLFKRLRMFTFMPTFRCPTGHSVDLEYTYRRPSLPLSNMFSVFEGKPYHQVRISPTYKINQDLFARGSAAWTKYSDMDNFRLTAGATYKGQSAGIVFAKGFSGVKLGLYGYLFYQAMKDLQLYLSGDAFNYKLDGNADKTIGNVAASFGAKYYMLKGLSSRAELQLLSNANYRHDTRFYLKLEYAMKKIYNQMDQGGGR